MGIIMKTPKESADQYAKEHYEYDDYHIEGIAKTSWMAGFEEAMKFRDWCEEWNWFETDKGWLQSGSTEHKNITTEELYSIWKKEQS